MKLYAFAFNGSQIGNMPLNNIPVFFRFVAFFTYTENNRASMAWGGTCGEGLPVLESRLAGECYISDVIWTYLSKPVESMLYNVSTI